jgi:hypothetical protein
MGNVCRSLASIDRRIVLFDTDIVHATFYRLKQLSLLHITQIP